MRRRRRRGWTRQTIRKNSKKRKIRISERKRIRMKSRYEEKVDNYGRVGEEGGRLT